MSRTVFEVVAAVVSGAYFMSTTVMDGTVTLWARATGRIGG